MGKATPVGDITAIEWTDHTFNPWWGCSRVSPACRFCYADRDAQRWGHQVWRRHGPRRMLSEANWATPLKWNRDAERAGVPAKVFAGSMCDVFEDHPDVAAPRERLWEVIGRTPWLIWQLLTKRPENIAGMVPWRGDWPGNVWAGTSVESQPWTVRAEVLVKIPAAVRFLSCEPLLGPLDLFGRPDQGCEEAGPGISHCAYTTPTDYGTGTEWGCDHQCGIDWVICGGESGPKARPMHPAWARQLRNQCTTAGVPFFFKQWGEYRPLRNGEYPPPGPTRTVHNHGDVADPIMVRVGKKAAGRLLDGRTWDEFPQAAERTAA